MATHIVRVSHTVQLQVKSSALVTVVARDRSFDMLVQTHSDVVLSGSYCLRARVPLCDSSRKNASEQNNETDANGEKNEDGFVYLPVSSGSFDADFDASGINMQELPAFDKALPIYLFRFRSPAAAVATNKDDVIFSLDDVKHEHDALVTVTLSETFRRWQPASNRTGAIDMSVTRLVFSGALLNTDDEQIELAYTKRIQLETPPSRTMRIVTTSVLSARACTPTNTSARAPAGTAKPSIGDKMPRPAGTAHGQVQGGKGKVELREVVVSLRRVGDGDLQRLGFSNDASADRERPVKRLRTQLEADAEQSTEGAVPEAGTDALHAGPVKCDHCETTLATGALLTKHIQVVHQLVCAVCHKKSPSLLLARQHYRECFGRLNDSLSRKVAVRTAPAPPTPTPAHVRAAASVTGGQKLTNSAFVGAHRLTAASPGSEPIAQKMQKTAAANTQPKVESTTCAVCKRVCKTVPGLKSHVQQAHRTVYYAVLVSIYRRCAATQLRAAGDRQPAFTVGSERLLHDPKSDELRTAIGAFFDELEVEKERSTLFVVARQFADNATLFESVVKTVEDRTAPCGESRRAIWNFFDVERLMRAIELADTTVIGDVLRTQHATSMTLSGLFDEVSSLQDTTTRPKDTSVLKQSDDDDDSTLDFDETQLDAASAEVSRLIREGPSGYLARCTLLESGYVKCAECQKVYQNEKAILKHRVRVHISKLRFRCTICDHASCDRHALEQHMFTHAKDGDTFECPECSASFESRTKLSAHLADTLHRQTNDDANALHKCPFAGCGFIFKSRAFLASHFDRMHAGQAPPPSPAKPPKLSVAESTAATVPYKKPGPAKLNAAPDVKANAGSAAGRTAPKADEVLYRCSVCEQLFPNKDAVFLHQDELLQAQTRFTALGTSATESLALANSSSGASLTENPLTENDIQYVCGLCDVVFTCECYANQHVRLLHPDNDAQVVSDEYSAEYGTSSTMIDGDSAMAANDDAALYTTMDDASHPIGLE